MPLKFLDMSEKNIKRYKILFLISLMGLSFIACKKEEPIKFSGDSFAYFINKASSTDYLDPSNMATVYEPVQNFSFLHFFHQQDTIKTNESYGYVQYPLYIQADGKLSNDNRPLSLEIEGNGKTYIVMPNPDSIYIPGNKREYKLNLKIVRPPLSDTSLKTVTLILKDNGSFKPEKHVWHTVTYEFGNILTLPYYYSSIEAKFGKFSAAKMAALQEAVNRSDKLQWENDPNVILLNTNLPNYGKRKIGFDPFSFDELYYFIEIGGAVFYIPYAPPAITDAYWAVSDKMISLTKQLIVERRAQNKPILDESGNEISFP